VVEEPDTHFRACFLEFSFSTSEEDIVGWVKGRDIPEPQDLQWQGARKRRATLCSQIALISKYLCPELQVLEEGEGPLMHRARPDRVFAGPGAGTLTVVVGDNRYNSAKVLSRPSKKQRKAQGVLTEPVCKPSAYDRAQEIREMESAVLKLVEAWDNHGWRAACRPASGRSSVMVDEGEG